MDNPETIWQSVNEEDLALSKAIIKAAAQIYQHLPTLAFLDETLPPEINILRLRGYFSSCPAASYIIVGEILNRAADQLAKQRLEKLLPKLLSLSQVADP